jgi:hypothetical protein
MSNIINTNTVAIPHRNCCFHRGCMTLACRRFKRFADINISKRLLFLSSNFIGGSRRFGRFGRLSPVSYWEGKCRVFPRM